MFVTSVANQPTHVSAHVCTAIPTSMKNCWRVVIFVQPMLLLSAEPSVQSKVVYDEVKVMFPTGYTKDFYLWILLTVFSFAYLTKRWKFF